MLISFKNIYKFIFQHIDYEGQRKSERIFQVYFIKFIHSPIFKVILVVHGVLGFIAGYMVQQLSVTIYTVGIGFAISCLVVLPPWPFYRRNPLNVCFFTSVIILYKKVFSGNQILRKMLTMDRRVPPRLEIIKVQRNHVN